MYNDERKKEYMEYYLSNNLYSDYNGRPKFVNAEYYEELLGKDLCEFTISEIMDYYRLICTPSLEYLMMVNSWFLNYTRWCISNSFVPDCQNHYEEVTNAMLHGCVNIGLIEERIISRDELIRNLNLLDNPSDRFMMLALFEGIFGKNYEEIYNANMSQIDGNVITTYSGRKLEISDLLVHYAEEASDEYTYYCFSNNGKSRIRQFYPDDMNIMKKTVGTVADDSNGRMVQFQRMYNRVKRVKEHFGSEAFRTKSLQESGRIHMIKELYRNGEYSDLHDCISKNRKEIGYRYGDFSSINRYILKYEKYYKEDLAN